MYLKDQTDVGLFEFASEDLVGQKAWVWVKKIVGETDVDIQEILIEVGAL
jgi:hypothetical protein